MPMNLSRFRVEALHGKRTINLEFKDNRLVLVGENGSGKSTIVNLLYYFLSRQWRRILEYDFKSISAVINNTTIEISREMVLNRRGEGTERISFPRKEKFIIDRIINELGSGIFEEMARNDSRLLDVATHYDVSPHRLYEYVHSFLKYSSEKSEQLTLSGHPRNQLLDISEAIRSHVTAQILYLPTYRRIEQELKSIFPKLNIEELDQYRHREDSSLRKRGGFVELVEFGMKDVEGMVEKTISKLRDHIRIGLNVLTASYLKDIINDAHKTLDLNELRRLDENKLIAFINNIDENTLAAFEKRRLREIVQKIRREESLSVDEKVISHFLFKLAQLRRQQEQNEVKVRDFIKIVNGYLIGKEFIYNDQEFQITIRSQEGEHIVQKDDEPTIALSDQIQMSMLSSGEKQIVSLFAHIYFSNEKEYFVIVDEPELSLSVSWQKKFLPDIMSTQRCAGLIAVTHSPFIYDNIFDTYARPLSRFVELSNVVRG